jgi:hypothetical protein
MLVRTGCVIVLAIATFVPWYLYWARAWMEGSP